MKFLHVAFGAADKPVSVEDVQKVFGGAGWARYAPNCWIVCTDESPKSLVDRLRPLCASAQDNIFVCELVIDNKWGYLQKEIWEWIEDSKKQVK